MKQHFHNLCVSFTSIDCKSHHSQKFSLRIDLFFSRQLYYAIIIFIKERTGKNLLLLKMVMQNIHWRYSPKKIWTKKMLFSNNGCQQKIFLKILHQIWFVCFLFACFFPNLNSDIASIVKETNLMNMFSN